MGRIAFVFPGQGAQKAGMGKDFYEQFEAARDIFDRASEAVGLSMPELCFTENDRLDITSYTQMAMVTTEIAIMEVVLSKGVRPDVAAGLSLGEYSALAAAGVMRPMDAIRVVKERGRLMQEAVPVGQGAMAAVLAMDAEQIQKVIADIDGVSIANYNCPGQIVISGRKESVEEAGAKLTAAGAKRVILLNVSGPFHSPMLAGAGEELGRVLEDIPVQKPRIPYVCNVEAAYVTEAEQVKPLLISQVSSSVRWQQSVERMIGDGVTSFIEIGPGRTLSGFIKKISRDVQVCNVDTVEDLEKLSVLKEQ